MPQVEMPVKEPEPKLPETDDKDILDKVIDTMDSDSSEKIQSEIVEVEERDVPSEDEVFGEPPEVKPLKEEFPVSTEFDDGKPKKRKYTRKQPMTQKQKDHLARIRKIAQEKRLKEKERKAKEKEEAQLKKVEERLLKKKQKEEGEKSEEESPPAQPKSRPRPQHKDEAVEYKEKPQMFSQADLDKAMLNAVATYDQYRKVQKKEKKKKQAEEAEQDRMKRTIQNAIAPKQTASANDPWRSLFT